MAVRRRRTAVGSGVTRSLLLDRDHRLVDQITDCSRHLLFALPLSRSPVGPGFLLIGDLLFDLADLSSLRVKPISPLVSNRFLERVERLIAGNRVPDDARAIDAAIGEHP